MKSKSILFCFASLVTLAITAFGINYSQNSSKDICDSDLLLLSVEALTADENSASNTGPREKNVPAAVTRWYASV